MLLLCHKMVSKGIESYKTSRNGHEKCIFETFTMRWNMLWISENHISMLKWDKIFTFPYGRPWPPLTVKSWITFSLSIQIHFQFRDSKKPPCIMKTLLLPMILLNSLLVSFSDTMIFLMMMTAMIPLMALASEGQRLEGAARALPKSHASCTRK